VDAVRVATGIIRGREAFKYVANTSHDLENHGVVRRSRHIEGSGWTHIDTISAVFRIKMIHIKLDTGANRAKPAPSADARSHQARA
jgi:hypothetical protein